MSFQHYTLAQLAHHLEAELKGDGDCVITGLATIQNAKPGEICFLSNSKYRKYLAQTQAAAVILDASEAENCPVNCLVMENPYLGYAKAAELFAPKREFKPGLHATVVCGEECQINPHASIGAHVTLGDNVIIESGVIIEAGCSIGDNVVIRANTHLYPRVVLYRGVNIGSDCVIHSGVVIGSDGFGMANHQGQWIKIPQLGSVMIGNRVEIGANTTIDRGALEDTVIEDGVKLDNQIQIGHNVVIGENTAIAGCVGISGSTKIGKNCAIGGGTCIAGHITIADNVSFTGMSGVYASIEQAGLYSSFTAVQESRTWIKNLSRLHHLDELARKLSKLEKMIAELQREVIA
ncbi:MAG: UDP-3-O-(3-hydroxymyristoyl)glucosamine N-acyltransferase [Legionellales bacterium]|nr:UDP-3-O-(3-hydroxymyristoyl)glucosamine N-acyltransferase [Legionellales bacterium]